ncbi:MAG: hypothetical protein HOO98_01645 [Nitrospira sp.]|nr:hypothetical protein [Nitrospira sp.]
MCGTWCEPISIFTFFLVIATGLLAYIALRQDETNRTVQRAYVQISAIASGLKWVSRSTMFDLALSLKNFGNTPATITGFAFEHRVIAHDGLLPLYPGYSATTRETRVFLVGGEQYTTYWQFTILPEELQAIGAQEMDLCIYGYVDYVDQFGTRHRAGYGRRYDPRGGVLGEGSNLIYLTQPHYNYDRERGRGEGHD